MNHSPFPSQAHHEKNTTDERIEKLEQENALLQQKVEQLMAAQNMQPPGEEDGHHIPRNRRAARHTGDEGLQEAETQAPSTEHLKANSTPNKQVIQSLPNEEQPEKPLGFLDKAIKFSETIERWFLIAYKYLMILTLLALIVFAILGQWHVVLALLFILAIPFIFSTSLTTKDIAWMIWWNQGSDKD